MALLKKGMFMNYQHHWIVDNMPVTWCYPVENGQRYRSTGFPMGCYVDKKGNPKDACVISRDYSTADNYYVFNHVDIVIYYHDGHGEDWGKYLSSAEEGGRIVAVKITPRSIAHDNDQIPRQIPDQSVYTQPIPGIIMGGVLPFGCIFIQLFFVLNSIWSSQIYYMYGFLFLVFIIL